MNRLIKRVALAPMNILYQINPKFELSLMFRLKNKYHMDWNNPITFNQKLQWLKVNYHSPLMEQCADKYAVRAYLEEKGCAEILNKLYWHGYDAKDIPFDLLPDAFVIKVTHGSGYNIFCYNKSELNISATVKKVNKWLKEKYMPCYGEEYYGKVKPSIIAEALLAPSDGSELVDYKAFCFNGTASFVVVCFSRFTKEGPQMPAYDMDWHLLADVVISYPIRDLDLAERLKKPAEFDELIRYAELLSRGFPHVRVDFYIVDGKIYFGEMTFTHGAGFDKILPYSFDRSMGDVFLLPKGEGSRI